MKFGNQVCSNLAGAFASFTCDLPVNSDGSVTAEAGSYIAVVTVDGVGRVAVGETVTAIDFGFQVLSATPNSAPANGGKVVELSGIGFPLSADAAVINVCG